MQPLKPIDGAASVQVPDFAYEEDDTHRPPFSWRLLWAYTGPGWLMSIAYLDPGNLESESGKQKLTQ